jgi:hypothetical protein
VHVGWKSEALVSMHIEGKFGLWITKTVHKTVFRSIADRDRSSSQLLAESTRRKARDICVKLHGNPYVFISDWPLALLLISQVLTWSWDDRIVSDLTALYSVCVTVVLSFVVIR